MNLGHQQDSVVCGQRLTGRQMLNQSVGVQRSHGQRRLAVRVRVQRRPLVPTHADSLLASRRRRRQPAKNHRLLIGCRDLGRSSL